MPVGKKKKKKHNALLNSYFETLFINIIYNIANILLLLLSLLLQYSVIVNFRIPHNKEFTGISKQTRMYTHLYLYELNNTLFCCAVYIRVIFNFKYIYMYIYISLFSAHRFSRKGNFHKKKKPKTKTKKNKRTK